MGKQGEEVRHSGNGAGGERGCWRRLHRRGGGARQGDDGRGSFGQGLARTARWHCDGDGEGAAASDRGAVTAFGQNRFRLWTVAVGAAILCRCVMDSAAPGSQSAHGAWRLSG
jgi:hypothetical protein